MTTINLELDVKNSNISFSEHDKKSLSFIVSRAFEEYLEDKQDEELSKQIMESSEFNKILSKIKI